MLRPPLPPVDCQSIPSCLAEGSTGINIFANGIDTRTRGVDFTLTSPQDLPFGHIDLTLGGSYNYTVVTRVLGGSAAIGNQPLFDAQSISALTHSGAPHHAELRCALHGEPVLRRPTRNHLWKELVLR